MALVHRRMMGAAGAVALGVFTTVMIGQPALAVNGCYGDCQPGVVRSNGSLRYDAPVGINDQITVTGDGTSLTIVDPAANLIAGTGCTLVTAHEARCSSTPWISIIIRGLDGDDVITNATGFASRLMGNDGNDRLVGGSGEDTLVGGFGADIIQGGNGADTASYSEVATRAAVHVDLDGASADDGSADDGPNGARDTIAADIENLTGTGGDDVLIGNGGTNVIDGNGGHDQIQGLGGDDRLTSRGGGAIDGGTGNDQCTSTLASQPVAPDTFTGCETTEIVP